MKLKNFRLLMVAASALTLFSGLASAGQIVIDDFTKPAPGNTAVLQSGTGTNSLTQTGLSPNVIGGTRAMVLTVNSGSQLDSLLVNVTNHDFSMSIGAGDDGFSTLTYDSNGALLGAAGNLLTNLAGGATASNTFFQAQVKFSDLNLNFTTSFTDTDGDVATFATVLGPGISFINQAFSSFTNAGVVNFDSIRSIQIRLDGPQAQDVKIGLLEITNTPETGAPEPATMALFGSALVGLGLFGRKRFAR